MNTLTKQQTSSEIDKTYLFPLNYQKKRAEDIYYASYKIEDTLEKYKQLSKAIGLNDTKAKYHREMAYTLLKINDKEKALEHYRIYRDLIEVDKFLNKNKISHTSILRYYLIKYQTGDLILKNGTYYSPINLNDKNNKTAKLVQITKTNPEHTSDKACLLQYSSNGKKTKSRNIKALQFIIAFFCLMLFGNLNSKHAFAAENTIITETVKTNNSMHQIVLEKDKTNLNAEHKGIPNKTPKNYAFLTLMFMLLTACLARKPSRIKLLFLTIAGLSILPYLSTAQTIGEGYGQVKGNNGTVSVPNPNVQMWLAEDYITTHDCLSSPSGIYQFSVDLGPVSVDIQEETQDISQVIAGPQFSDVNITYTTQHEPTTARVFDMTGKLVDNAQIEYNGSQAHVYWNAQGQHTGVYIIQTNDKTEKVMVNPQGQPRGNLSLEDLVYANTMQTKSFKDAQIVEKDVVRRVTTESIYLPYQDTVTIHQGDNGFIEEIYLETISTRGQDLVFQLKDTYTREGLENFTINIKNEETTQLISTATTDENGLAHFENVPIDISLYLEYGGQPSHFASKGNIWHMPEDIIYMQDTIGTDTIKITLPPKQLPIPATVNDPNYNTTVDDVIAWDIIEMIRGPPDHVDIEEAMGRPVRIYVKTIGSNSFLPSEETLFHNLLAQGDSLFYGSAASPWIITNSETGTEFAINEINTLNYDFENNYIHPDTIGWNIIRGGDYTSFRGKTILKEINNENNQNNNEIVLSLGGEITLSMGATGFYKEMYHRRTGMDDVTSRPSFGNPTATLPNLKDRAIFLLRNKNNQNRFFYQIDYYSLDNTVDEL